MGVGIDSSYIGDVSVCWWLEIRVLGRGVWGATRASGLEHGGLAAEEPRFLWAGDGAPQRLRAGTGGGDAEAVALLGRSGNLRTCAAGLPAAVISVCPSHLWSI